MFLMETSVKNHRLFPIVNLFNPSRKLKKTLVQIFQTVNSSTKFNLRIYGYIDVGGVCHRRRSSVTNIHKSSKNPQIQVTNITMSPKSWLEMKKDDRMLKI